MCDAEARVTLVDVCHLRGVLYLHAVTFVETENGGCAIPAGASATTMVGTLTIVAVLLIDRQ